MPALEAMTVGVPVVAANRGALPEVVGAAGRLFEPDDADALAGAPARDPDRRHGARRMRDAGWARARRVQLGGHRARRARGLDAAVARRRQRRG